MQQAQVAFLAAFMADERLRAHVRAGQLELVLWDHLGECVGPPHMRCWQPIVYSHALLEAWGAGALLLMSDIDEYFVLPKPGMTLAGVLEGCTGGKSMVCPPTSYTLTPGPWQALPFCCPACHPYTHRLAVLCRLPGCWGFKPYPSKQLVRFSSNIGFTLTSVSNARGGDLRLMHCA